MEKHAVKITNTQAVQILMAVKFHNAEKWVNDEEKLTEKINILVSSDIATKDTIKAVKDPEVKKLLASVVKVLEKEEDVEVVMGKADKGKKAGPPPKGKKAAVVEEEVEEDEEDDDEEEEEDDEEDTDDEEGESEDDDGEDAETEDETEDDDEEEEEVNEEEEDDDEEEVEEVEEEDDDEEEVEEVEEEDDDEEEEEDDDEEEEEDPKPTKKKGKTMATKTPTKPEKKVAKVEKKVAKPSRNGTVVRDWAGAGMDTRAHRLNMALSSKPKTVAEIKKAADYDKPIHNHLKDLLNKGLIVQVDKDGNKAYMLNPKKNIDTKAKTTGPANRPPAKPDPMAKKANVPSKAPPAKTGKKK
jgi:hypothetical protein